MHARKYVFVQGYTELFRSAEQNINPILKMIIPNENAIHTYAFINRTIVLYYAFKTVDVRFMM